MSDRTQAAAAELAPSATAVRRHLQDILTSPRFQNCPRIRAFLSFVIEEALAGRGDRLKEHTIAQAVFDKDESFDPKESSLVRVEAGRLRARLRGYYRNEGKADSMRLEIPKGGYQPQFRHLPPAQENRSGGERSNRSVLAQLLVAWPRALLLSAALMVLAVALVAILLHAKAPWPLADDQTAKLATESKRAIAVLPPEASGGPREAGRFAEGLGQEIAAGLTQFKGLSVLPRSAVEALAVGGGDLIQAGRERGVDFLLEGSVRQDRDLLRVTLQLVDMEKGSNIWADSYDLSAADAESLEAQRQIAAEVVATLGDPNGVMARAALAQLQDQDPESLGPDDCVLQLYAYRGEASPDVHAAVRHCLLAAVEQAPMHAEAWAGLAWVALDEHRYGFNRLEPEKMRGEAAADSALERALTRAQKAVALDPGNARVHLALAAAHFYRGEIREFETAARDARELNPNDTDLLAELATYYALSGRWTLGRRLLKDAEARNPAHAAWYDFVAILDLYRQGDFEAAAASARKLHAPDWYWTHVLRAMACARIGDIEGVRASRDRLLALYPEFPGRAREEFRRLGVSSAALIEEFLVGLRQAGLLPADPAGLTQP